MDHTFQRVFLLFFIYISYIQGSRAGMSMYVKKGSDLQLDVQEAAVVKSFTFFAWKINGKHNLVLFSPNGTPLVSELYTGRAEFSVTNYTVKLKNVQETDSGLYTAVFTGKDDQTAAIYNVTVQAPVSPVNLTVDSVSSSSDSCNLTVTCRTQDSNIRTTFTCVNQICSEDGDRSKATTSGAVLHVYTENNSINCNHSNQVSWTTYKGAKTEDFCHQQPSPTSTAGVVVGSVAGVLVLAFVGFILCKKNKDKKKSYDNTVYDVPQDINSAQTQTQESITSTYAMVQKHIGPEHPTNTVNTPKPETIYAQVMKPAKSNSPSLESPTSDSYSI